MIDRNYEELELGANWLLVRKCEETRANNTISVALPEGNRSRHNPSGAVLVEVVRGGHQHMIVDVISLNEVTLREGTFFFLKKDDPRIYATVDGDE